MAGAASEGSERSAVAAEVRHGTREDASDAPAGRQGIVVVDASHGEEGSGRVRAGRHLLGVVEYEAEDDAGAKHADDQDRDHELHDDDLLVRRQLSAIDEVSHHSEDELALGSEHVDIHDKERRILECRIDPPCRSRLGRLLRLLRDAGADHAGSTLSTDSWLRVREDLALAASIARATSTMHPACGSNARLR